jgi:predicted RNA-binding Zn ribbon-like protein
MEFVLTGVSAPLNLVATVGRRHSVSPVERIPDRAALVRWMAESGVAPTLEDASADELDQARQLREAIYGLVRTRIEGHPPPPAALSSVNEAAARPALGDRLVPTPSGLRAEPLPGTASEALARIAREAVRLLGGPDADRVKECERPECSLLFLDETQSGRRRWCSMERCGNLAKTAGYRARRRSRPETPVAGPPVRPIVDETERR